MNEGHNERNNLTRLNNNGVVQICYPSYLVLQWMCIQWSRGACTHHDSWGKQCLTAFLRPCESVSLSIDHNVPSYTRNDKVFVTHGLQRWRCLSIDPCINTAYVYRYRYRYIEVRLLLVSLTLWCCLSVAAANFPSEWMCMLYFSNMWQFLASNFQFVVGKFRCFWVISDDPRSISEVLSSNSDAPSWENWLVRGRCFYTSWSQSST